MKSALCGLGGAPALRKPVTGHSAADGWLSASVISCMLYILKGGLCSPPEQASTLIRYD